jgi:hypothetical protein
MVPSPRMLAHEMFLAERNRNNASIPIDTSLHLYYLSKPFVTD